MKEMPTYEYACASCKRRFEVVQSFSEAPLETCEECGGTLKRVFHPVGILLKGSGFYSTDNRARSAGATKEKEAAKTEPASTETKKSQKKPSGEKPANGGTKAAS